MKNSHLLSLLCLGSLIISGCSKESGNNVLPTPDPVTPDPVKTEKMEIKISASLSDTKATDYGFETGDKIGLYVVNYKDGTPGTLKNAGNHVDNMCHTYSGIWTPDEKIYWADNQTHADIYMYYPFTNVTSVSAMPFAVKSDQSAESNYKASDLMAGKTLNVAPTEDAISIVAKHLLSRVNIKLEAGNGYTSESLADSKIDVKINGVKTNAVVDLASASVSAAGDAAQMTPFYNNGTYKAIVVPQSVGEGTLISIKVDEREFKFNKAFTFESGKNHNFTITVSKTSTGVNVSISGWEDDGVDNGGTAE